MVLGRLAPIFKSKFEILLVKTFILKQKITHIHPVPIEKIKHFLFKKRVSFVHTVNFVKINNQSFK